MDKYALHKMFKMHGLSLTTPRRVIFNALRLAEKPLTIRELITVCNTVDRVSVYRTVEQFEKIGIISRIQIGWKYKLELNDYFHSHHHHLTCTYCGKVVEFKEPPTIAKQLKAIASEVDFHLEQHTLELRGICATCRLQIQ